jgi:hypothetical protein
MGEAYDLVNTAKTKLPGLRLVVSGILRSRCVSWRRVGAANDRLKWIAGAPGSTLVGPNRWIRDQDFSRDGLHLNGSGASQLGELCSRVCERGIENQMVTDNCLHMARSGFSEETSKVFTKTTNQENWTRRLVAEVKGEKAKRVTRYSAGTKKEDGTTNQIQTIAQEYKFGGKSLVLLQVNCRSIYN